MPEQLLAPVMRALTDHGPLTEDELADALVAAGVDLGDDPDGALADVLDEDSGALLMPLADDRWVALPALLAGRVFTHRLTAAEVEHDLVNVDPDLAPMAFLTERPEYQQLADGSQVHDVLAPFDADLLAARDIPLDSLGESGALLLAPGTLSARGAQAGDVIGLRLAAGGLDVETVRESSAAADLGARLADSLSADDEPEMLNTFVWTACADDATLFRHPVAPLSELLVAAGLQHDGDWVARPGFDFAAWRTRNRVTAVARRYRLPADRALAVVATVMLFGQVADLLAAAHAAVEHDDDPTALRALVDALPAERSPAGAPCGRVSETLSALADPEVAQAVLDETHTGDGEGAAALGLFAETLEPMAPRAARPALRWLRAKAYERLGDVLRAEAVLREAQALDPAWPPTLIDLARYAGDRGDAARALSLLRRAGVPSRDAFVELLQRYEATPRADLGRNQRCWCGSDRKYKQCHLHREQLSLSERASWLYQKAALFLQDGAWRGEVFDVADARAQYDESPDAFVNALQDPLVPDAVLFEGGAFADFVAVRGPLLPDDERLLAELWVLAERSVYEVLDVRRGKDLSVRDVRSGDVHEVRERVAAEHLRTGQLICAHLLPVGDELHIFGGIEPVELHRRDELIELLDSEPSPLEVVTFLTRRFAPIALHNTEGEPLVMCEATLRVSDPAGMAKALDEAYDRDDGEPLWLEHVLTDGMNRIRATLRLDGAQLQVATNSEPRFDRVLAVVRNLDPDSTVLGETREPANDMRQLEKLAERMPGKPSDLLDPADHPEIAAALDQFTREYEQRWLDDPIPALAGHTPRECAADPTRRPDLIRLLDSFPEADDQAGAMSPARLRAALGLP